MALSVKDQLTQLEAARQLVLADAALYPQIVQGILPIIGANARLELRRWGAEFLAETFASPTIATQQKQTLGLVVLQTLRDLLEIPGEDAGIVKSVVQTAASVYGLVFRYIISNPHDSMTWENMAAIKSNILKRWDTAAVGVRICCIKFVQRVVHVQTPGVIADPRRPERNEASLALVPRDHPLIPPPFLEAEASGLLDRLLNVFHEYASDAVLVNATLNCFNVLIQTRPSIANKIVSATLNFDPTQQVKAPITPKTRVQIKSMERTTRALLMNILRKNESGPLASRMKQHIDRLAQSRLEVLEEGSRKRGAPTEPPNGVENVKRTRMEQEISIGPSLPPGPTSVAQLFTMTGEQGIASFDVTQLPLDLVVRITLPVFFRLDTAKLDEAINSVRSRYVELGKIQHAALQVSKTQLPNADDEDDYEPDFEPSEDREQILNKTDALPPEDSQSPKEVALGPFKFPPPPPMTLEETKRAGQGMINRVFGMMDVLDEPGPMKKQKLKPGLNRLAGSNYDKEAWITIITRIATRATSGLEDSDQCGKDQIDTKGALVKQSSLNLVDGIRETLWKYIVEDFRVRIKIAISWLNEEWFNDRIQAQAHTDGESKPPKRHYEIWLHRVLDGILPYLDAKDKILTRFLSEIPGLDEEVLERIKGLARDPERVTLAVNALHYLILLRPPVREICIDALEDLWRNYDDAKAPTTKLLAKWRPHILEDKKSNGLQVDNKEGIKEGSTSPTAATQPTANAIVAKSSAFAAAG